jgi:hypothetical protein
MAETTADVRRDIELTRERMSTTLAQLERKLNVVQIVRDHPWPALGLAFGAGILLSGSKADVKAAAASVAATKGATSRLTSVLDELVASVVTNVNGAFQQRVDGWLAEVKGAIGAPTTGAHGRGSSITAPAASQFGSTGYASGASSGSGPNVGGGFGGTSAGAAGLGSSAAPGYGGGQTTRAD